MNLKLGLRLRKSSPWCQSEGAASHRAAWRYNMVLWIQETDRIIGDLVAALEPVCSSRLGCPNRIKLSLTDFGNVRAS